MPDKPVECSICGKSFVWSEGEQAFYSQRGLTQPKRCKDCRSKNDKVVLCCDGMSDLSRRGIVKTVAGTPMLVVHWGDQETVQLYYCPFCAKLVRGDKKGSSSGQA